MIVELKKTAASLGELALHVNGMEKYCPFVQPIVIPPPPSNIKGAYTAEPPQAPSILRMPCSSGCPLMRISRGAVTTVTNVILTCSGTPCKYENVQIQTNINGGPLKGMA
jgi:hypothetical protein